MTNYARPMKIARLLPALVAVLLVAGCSATPPTASKPTASVGRTATPTPTATPMAEPVVDRVAFDSTGISLLRNDGSIADTFTYFQPAAEVVAALTSVFGAEPTVEDIKPYEGYRYTRYDWTGFAVEDSVEPSDGAYYVDFRVNASAASLNGIAIRTVDTITVGSDTAAVEAAHPEHVTRVTPPNVGVETSFIEVDTRVLPDYVGDGYTTPASFYVTVIGPVGGVVERIYAPSGGGPGI